MPEVPPIFSKISSKCFSKLRIFVLKVFISKIFLVNFILGHLEASGRFRVLLRVSDCSKRKSCECAEPPWRSTLSSVEVVYLESRRSAPSGGSLVTMSIPAVR